MLMMVVVVMMIMVVMMMMMIMMMIQAGHTYIFIETYLLVAVVLFLSFLPFLLMQANKFCSFGIIQFQLAMECDCLLPRPNDVKQLSIFISVGMYQAKARLSWCTFLRNFGTCVLPTCPNYDAVRSFVARPVSLQRDAFPERLRIFGQRCCELRAALCHELLCRCPACEIDLCVSCPVDSAAPFSISPRPFFHILLGRFFL